MPLLSFEQALALVLENAVPLEPCLVSLTDAHLRCLAFDLSSAIDLPRFDNSQMDGYAVRFEELPTHVDGYPYTLPVSGVVAAGEATRTDLMPQSALKIFTGAPLPFGADTVIPIEDVDVSEDGQLLAIAEKPRPHQFVRYKAEDVTAGQIIARAGDLVTAGRIALLSSAGRHRINVHRAPRVVVLTNGDELANESVRPEELGAGQIYESNGVMLSALATESGAELVATITTPDSRSDLVRELSAVQTRYAPDLIISSGGVSVGDRDFVRSAVSEMGEVVFWRAAIRPGKPIMYGKIGSTHFLGLPGNPASTLVTFELFARPLLAKLAGGHETDLFVPTNVSTGFAHQTGRRSFVRAHTMATPGGLVSALAGEQGSHYVTSLAGANSLVVLPENVSVLAAGSIAQCLLTGPLHSV